MAITVDKFTNAILDRNIRKQLVITGMRFQSNYVI